MNEGEIRIPHGLGVVIDGDRQRITVKVELEIVREQGATVIRRRLWLLDERGSFVAMSLDMALRVANAILLIVEKTGSEAVAEPS